MKRTVVIGTVGALFTCITLPLLGQNSGQNAGHDAPAAAQHQPLPRPTNLQVLPKDIAPADLIKLMHGYSAALGVHCNFCHEVDEKAHKADFAADTKHDKIIARTMIAMTQEINSKFMTRVQDPDATLADKTVTCGTCHRGKTMPAQFEPQPGEQHHDHPAGEMPMPKQ